MSTPNRAQSKPKASDKGRYRCAVFFKDHRIPNGNAFVMWSNKNQDNRNVSVNSFKQKILRGEKFEGKVNWAGIYENGNLIWEYKDDAKTWAAAK
jgi:hypothetical protein